jgi:flagellin
MPLTFQSIQTLSVDSIKNTNRSLADTVGRISSGDKLGNIGDDALGYSKAQKLQSSATRLQASKVNIQNAVSYAQTTNSFLGNIMDVLTRMSEIASQARGVSVPAEDIKGYEYEFNQLSRQLQDIIGQSKATDGKRPHATFNGIELFAPQTENGVKVVITDDSSSNALRIPEVNLRAGAITQFTGVTFNFDTADIASLVTNVNKAIEQVGNELATMSGVQYRLEQNLAGNDISLQNIESAYSRFRDADIASESTKMAKFNILLRSNYAVMAQANLTPRQIIEALAQ